MLKLSEKTFAIAMLFYTSSALFPLMAGGQNTYARLEGNLPALMLQFVFYIGAFWFIALHWRTVIHGALNVKWIIFLVLVAIASTAWSQDPLFTFRRSIVLVGTTAFGIYFGSRFTVPQQLRLLAWTSALVVFLSFVFAIVFPQHGIDHFLHPGDWQGVFTQKNGLGRAMVLAVLVFYFARPSMGRSVRWLGIAGAFVLLVLSRSVTGAIVFAAIIATLPLYRLLREKMSFAIPVVIGIAIVAVGSILALTFSSTDVLQLVNRSSGLSGRTELWDATMMAIVKHPWLGYGFNGFWQGMTGESASVLLMVRWAAPHSHNGFLDLLLSLGVLGLGTFAVGYFGLCWKAIVLIKQVRGPVPVWLCTYLAFMFFYNLTESSILVQNNIFWVLYTSTAVSLSLAMRGRRPVEKAVSEDEFQPALEAAAG